MSLWIYCCPWPVCVCRPQRSQNTGSGLLHGLELHHTICLTDIKKLVGALTLQTLCMRKPKNCLTLIPIVFRPRASWTMFKQNNVFVLAKFVKEDATTRIDKEWKINGRYLATQLFGRHQRLFNATQMPGDPFWGVHASCLEIAISGYVQVLPCFLVRHFSGSAWHAQIICQTYAGLDLEWYASLGPARGRSLDASPKARHACFSPCFSCNSNQGSAPPLYSRRWGMWVLLRLVLITIDVKNVAKCTLNERKQAAASFIYTPPRVMAIDVFGTWSHSWVTRTETPSACIHEGRIACCSSLWRSIVRGVNAWQFIVFFPHLPQKPNIYHCPSAVAHFTMCLCVENEDEYSVTGNANVS